MAIMNAATLTTLLLTALPQPAGASEVGKASAQAWLKTKVASATALAERTVEPETPGEQVWQEEAKTLLNDMLDWSVMTEQSLGATWRKLSARDKSEFQRLLREMIEASYESKLRLAVRGEQRKPRKVDIEWDPSEAPPEPDLVSARVRADSQDALIGFRVRHSEGHWRVTDVIIDDVSTVRTYRSQFRRIIDREGAQGLLERIRRKTEEIRSGRGELAP